MQPTTSQAEFAALTPMEKRLLMRKAPDSLNPWNLSGTILSAMRGEELTALAFADVNSGTQDAARTYLFALVRRNWPNLSTPGKMPLFGREGARGGADTRFAFVEPSKDKDSWLGVDGGVPDETAQHATTAPMAEPEPEMEDEPATAGDTRNDNDGVPPSDAAGELLARAIKALAPPATAKPDAATMGQLTKLEVRVATVEGRAKDLAAELHASKAVFNLAAENASNAARAAAASLVDAKTCRESAQDAELKAIAAATEAKRLAIMVDEGLADALATIKSAPPARKELVAKKMKATGLMRKLLDYAPPGANPGNHVLLVGPSGTGKSYTAREFALLHDWNMESLRDKGRYIPPLGLHKYSEPHNLKGSALPTDASTTPFAFVAGLMTDAFRAAANGKSACLILDELLRAAPELLDSLLTVLDPIPTADGLVYILETGKPILNGDGLWHSETITAPAHLITIVATSNIGSDYGIGDPDQALWDRFLVLQVDRDSDTEEQAFRAAAEFAGFTGPALDGVVNLAKLVLRQTRSKAGASNELQHPETIRTLCRSLSQSKGKPADLKRRLVDALESRCRREADGRIFGQHLKAVAELANEIRSFVIPADNN